MKVVELAAVQDVRLAVSLGEQAAEGGEVADAKVREASEAIARLVRS